MLLLCLTFVLQANLCKLLKQKILHLILVFLCCQNGLFKTSMFCLKCEVMFNFSFHVRILGCIDKLKTAYSTRETSKQSLHVIVRNQALILVTSHRHPFPYNKGFRKFENGFKFFYSNYLSFFNSLNKRRKVEIKLK